MKKFTYNNSNYSSKIFTLRPKAKVLTFRRPSNHIVSDKELTSMFMGLIRLIRQDEREIVISELKEKLRLENTNKK